ncbi:nucleosome assembly protein [Xylariales sp. AK1849]|nr:nucleosome assembly protein [Xylariales sp. AK1849]
MAAEMEETSVTYEQLADLEREFEDAEVEIIRQQAALTQPLYEKRQKTVAKIGEFWPLVFEQAPPEIDTYIHPQDHAVLLQSLRSFSVSRFELDDGGKGEPRSFAIKFEFDENDYFEDSVLEKKFWHRRAKTGWAGLVSDPVPIKWKAGKDLTDGMLDMVMTVWEQEKTSGQLNGNGSVKSKDLTPEQKTLQKKIQSTGLGGASFFAWFGFRGFHVSAEESHLANEKEDDIRRRRAEGKSTEENGAEDDEEAPDLVGKEEEDEDEVELEIFPDGDELAIAFAEDLWPSALKYFTQAQEQDGMSEMDFEEDGEDEDEDEDEENEAVVEEPPAKKRKA